MEELNHKDKMKSNVFLYNEKVFSSPYLINVDEIDSHFVSSYNKLKVVNIITNFELSHETSKGRIYNEKCSICKADLTFSKYICCICKNCILCNICEKEHYHPVIKCKNNKLANFSDIIHYFIHHQFPKPKNSKGVISSLFEKKIKLQLSTSSLNFTVRPSKQVYIPIYIENLTSNCIDKSSILYLISRNCENVFIQETTINSAINKKEKSEIDLLIQTPEVCKVYKFTIEIYPFDSKLKIEANKLNFTIEVNNDTEEENLNEYFKDYPKLIYLDKDKKNKIKSIIEEKISLEHPYIIFKMLQNFKWDVNRAITELINLRENKEESDMKQKIDSEKNVDEIDIGTYISPSKLNENNDELDFESTKNETKEKENNNLDNIDF